MPTAAKHEISLDQLKAKYKTIYTIEGVDAEGTPLVGYYRAPDFETRKIIFALAQKNGQDFASIGEVILSKCHVGGENFMLREDVKFEACVQAAQLVEFNDSFTVKKN